MKVIRLGIPNNLKSESLPPLSIAIGFFDGIHIGHKEVILTAKKIAEENNWKSAVMTFDPSPKEVLSKNPENVKYITLLDEKIEIIEKLGLDYLFIVPFTRELASFTPEYFIDNYIIQLNVKHLTAGFDYTYGKFGKGTMETIRDHSKGQFNHTTVGKVTKNKEKISSTLIRSLISEGKVEEVNEYLGRHYTMAGYVVHGEKRGRKLGFPTANLQIDDRYVYPRNGVYVVRLYVNGTWVNGVASIGYNPTFNEEKTKRFVEVYLLDFDDDIYGQSVILEWRKYLRDELKFDSIDDLILQMKQDEHDARNYFKQMS
ncbi:bifunctional riboflavin kinase/FAD synthetase [Pallidibacillus pasinlerensis]|uniref:Riboflavin biosynthesis protein n=1 Tax=Pallidibacillus pasinlerensis TaxID=2703818 RepID=A0ABW9ZZ84_9BACI|nr:bifunctional riboflavin kinase/FAD synthetase [Pallidibacillus pasinlerensis]NCU16486.1 bifunctional riboflavin kinase/FAD synthetase [Pallidibacillus pasinlerensis]